MVRLTHGDFNARDDTCVPEYLAMTRCHLYQRYSHSLALAEAILRSLSVPPQERPIDGGTGGRKRSPIGRAHLATWATSAGGHARPSLVDAVLPPIRYTRDTTSHIHIDIYRYVRRNLPCCFRCTARPLLPLFNRDLKAPNNCWSFDPLDESCDFQKLSQKHSAKKI